MLTSFFVVSVSAVFYNINKKNILSKLETSAYLITDSTFYSNYSKYSTFEINSLSGLQAVATYCYKTGYPWTGKTIKLTADINCNGAAVSIGSSYIGGNYGGTSVTPYFNGTFDGNNYTISNLVVSGTGKTLVN